MVCLILEVHWMIKKSRKEIKKTEVTNERRKKDN